MAAIREVGPQGHFLGTQHTLEHFESRLLHALDHGLQLVRAMEGRRAQRTTTRAAARRRRNMLADYEEPKLDEGIAEGLKDFIARRESELPNTVS